MYFDVPSNVQRLDVWDGDFDRGTLLTPDSDDPNIEGKPVWSSMNTADEGIGGLQHDGTGSPNDDTPIYYYRLSPAVSYEVLDPLGQVIFASENPSGAEEWEKFTISSSSAENPDVLVNEALTAGLYNIHIKGLDLKNPVWLGVNYPICDPNGCCPPRVWVDESCPRPIGYCNKAINTVYTKNKNYGLKK